MRKLWNTSRSPGSMSTGTEADAGILYRPPENVVREFPQFPVTRDYDELRAAFEHAAGELS